PARPKRARQAAAPHSFRKSSPQDVTPFIFFQAPRQFAESFAPFVDRGGQRGSSLSILSPMNRQLGFTIIELMVAIAVLGVLMGIRVPGMQSFLQNSRLTSQINLLSTSLAIARSEAIKKQNCTNAKEQLADQQGAEGHKGIL
ncbi:MAG: prepilin-type N-terminal cleavage/methylation domain-containing protein, partial [Pseudomonadota bacterium]|nr:prepilin-type N-terminal cleavage/methylation domain-containing protein [Pseudomonadota bacterium]